MVEVEMDWLSSLFKSNPAKMNAAGATAPHNTGAALNLENPGAVATPVNGATAPLNAHGLNTSAVGGRRNRSNRRNRSRKDRKDRKNRKDRKDRKSRRASRN
jgi:hypothetical protein